MLSRCRNFSNTLHIYFEMYVLTFEKTMDSVEKVLKNCCGAIQK